MHLCRSGPLQHHNSTPLQCWDVYFDLLRIPTPSFQNTQTHTHRSSALDYLPKLGQAFHGRPQTLLCRCRVTSASDINTLCMHRRLCVCVCVCTSACSQTDLASSPGARHTAHNTQWRVPCSSFQPLFSFLPSLLFLWFFTSSYGICYMRRQRPKPTLLKYGCSWHRNSITVMIWW